MSKAKKGPNGSDIEETVEVSPDKKIITTTITEIIKSGKDTSKPVSIKEKK